MKYTIDYSEKFKNQLKQLRKKYPNCGNKIKECIEQLEDGILLGEPYDELGLPANEDVYKVRIANPDARKGVRGGFRIIYYVVRDDKYIDLLVIYSKLEVDNVTQAEILEILKEIREDEDL